jgi:hypothetical protein
LLLNSTKRHCSTTSSLDRWPLFFAPDPTRPAVSGSEIAHLVRWVDSRSGFLRVAYEPFGLVGNLGLFQLFSKINSKSKSKIHTIWNHCSSTAHHGPRPTTSMSSWEACYHYYTWHIMIQHIMIHDRSLAAAHTMMTNDDAGSSLAY